MSRSSSVNLLFGNSPLLRSGSAARWLMSSIPSEGMLAGSISPAIHAQHSTSALSWSRGYKSYWCNSDKRARAASSSIDAAWWWRTIGMKVCMQCVPDVHQGLANYTGILLLYCEGDRHQGARTVEVCHCMAVLVPAVVGWDSQPRARAVLHVSA